MQIVKVFVLGMPGSGKSTIGRHIVERAKQQHQEWMITRFNDYQILHRMFEQDQGKLFWPAEHGGFIVREPSIYNEALKQLEENVNQFCSSNTGYVMTVIEFARSDYQEALRQFNRDFVLGAYFLFLDANIDVCIERIHERIAHPKNQDDNFVPETVFTRYQGKDSKQYFSEELKAEYEIFDDYRVKIIDNTRQFEDIMEEVNQFIGFILTRESSRSASCGLESK